MKSVASCEYTYGDPVEVTNEITRDMTPNRDIFAQAIELFGSDQEDVRVAAAFAAGM